MGLLALDRRLAVVVSANFLAVAGRMSLVTFLGIYYVHQAGIALATVGAAFLVENLLRGAAAPLYGAASDRLGRRPLLIGGALATAAVLPGFLLVHGPATLFAWSLAMGAVGGIHFPVSSALLLDLSPPERRQTVLALNYTVMSVGYSIGVMPAGYLAERGYGLLAAAASASFVLVAVLYAAALRRPVPRERASAEGSLARHTLAALRDPVFAAFAALGFVFPLGIGLVVFATPLFAADLGLDEGFIGLVLGGNSLLVALAAVPVAARLEARGPFRPLGIAAALVAVAFGLYAAVPGPHAALVAGTLAFTFGELVFSSAVPAAVARLASPGARGAYQGAWSLVHASANGGALFVSGLLRESLGWRAAWALYAALIGAAALGLLAARGRFLAIADRRAAAPQKR